MTPAARNSLSIAPRTLRGLIVAAAVLLLIAGALAAGAPARLWANLLLNGFLGISLALAGLLFIAIQRVSGAGWWVVLRRVPEAMAGMLPAAALLLAVVAFGRRSLYGWMRPEAALDPILTAKRGYLNEPFFLARAAVILGLWVLFAHLLGRASRAQDAGDSVGEHRRMRLYSAVFLPVFALTVSIACFDWLMSLDPHWYSTIFAVYGFAGLLLGGLAAIVLAVLVLAANSDLGGLVHDSHLHDLGKLLFGFSTFWAYIWVSQYLLIWYANIPEEAVYFVERTRGAWTLPFALVLVLNWLLPFCLLLSRSAKRNPKILAGAAVAVLAGRWLDLYVHIGPPVLGEPHFGLVEVLFAAAYALVFIALFLRGFAGAPILAIRDPYLAESVAHHAG